jgi:hypothetical protein
LSTPITIQPGPALRRQEAQEVHLLADLCDQREGDGGRRAECEQVQPALAEPLLRGELRPAVELGGRVRRDERERQQAQQHPHRLRQHLEAADQGDAMGDQRDHCERADEIAGPQRNAEAHLQRHGQDHGFDREEDERERGVDQRGDGGADVAEPGAAGQQVHVDAVLRGVVADGQAGEEDDEPDHGNCHHGVAEAVAQGDRCADRLEGEKRDRAQRGVGHAQARPLARGLRGEAQRIVLERLVRDELVVLAPHARDALDCGHRNRAAWFRNAERGRAMPLTCRLKV